MRSIYLLFILIILTSSAGCSTGDASKQLAASANTDSRSALSATSSPEKTVREYLNWYSTNQDKLPRNFVAEFSSRDTTDYYTVDFRVTENWLGALRDSNLFSNRYLQHWRTYFNQYADTLKLRHQNDGPAMGFDYDFLMLSQEPDTRVAELLAGTYTTKLLSSTSAEVVALGPQHDGWREGMAFILSKSATGEWLIDAMSVPHNLTQ